MQVWLITVGEPLPTDSSNERLFRAGMIADTLVRSGHDVLWWTSSFDHVKKRHRVSKDMLIQHRQGYRLYLLHSFGYKNNVSLRRVIDHFGIARKFSALAQGESFPDIIFCSLPPIELCVAATKFGAKKGIPVVLDIRDLWPDIFLDLAPRWARGLGRLALKPMFRGVRRACSQARAITGLTSAYVDWGARHAGRPRTALDRVFPMAYSANKPGPEALISSEKFWKKQGIFRDGKHFGACFFGFLGRQFDLETVIGAARHLKSHPDNFRFVLCGTGDQLGFYKRLADDCPNIFFPGWVGMAEIWSLMRLSSVGLAPYRNTCNFVGSIPNKPIEYLSAGLPIVSSLNGVLQGLLDLHQCGVTYENGNPESLATALISLNADRERLRKMSENARKLYEQQFVAEKVYGELTDYLEELAVARISHP